MARGEGEKGGELPATVPLKNEAGKVIGTADVSPDGTAVLKIQKGDEP